MKPRRLVIVRQKYRPDGGAEHFISQILEGLRQYNLDLNIITREWQRTIKPNYYQIHLCNPQKFGRIRRERSFSEAARTMWQKGSFDLVQSHERIPGCDIYRAGDGVHRRWLIQRSRLLPAWRRKYLFSNRYHRYIMYTERAIYTSPELKSVICNSEMIKQEIIADFEVPDDKITVIYNAIDSQNFFPPNAKKRQFLRNQYQIPQEVHCLIFVGSGFERKGLANAIRAVAATKSHLLIVGKDKSEWRYRSLAQSLGCSQRLYFMGMQKHVLPFYQAVDGLLLPTLYDPFPNVILEAMSCGLPVITSTSCGGAEFITPGQHGMITDALDVKGISEAIRALPHQAIGSPMAEAVRLRIMSATLTHLSKQLVSLYNRLAD